MKIKLIHQNWNSVFQTAIQEDSSSIQVICPFIKRKTIENILTNVTSSKVQIITRFNLNDFYDGVSDLDALEYLLEEHDAQIKGIKHLHAKTYIFGESTVIVTSANLTQAALYSNHEFGFVSTDKEIIQQCKNYFHELWNSADNIITKSDLEAWSKQVNQKLIEKPAHKDRLELPDNGVIIKSKAPEFVDTSGSESYDWFKTDIPSAFVKFFGNSTDRYERQELISEIVKSSGCHWACTYPESKTPRQPVDGSIMFMSGLVKDPDDIIIFGWAVALKHDEERDYASSEEITLRPWKKYWPKYIRVHHPEFLKGSLQNGISLNKMMENFKADSFLSTQKNAVNGKGNIDPRKAYNQQASVQLTTQSLEWLQSEFINLLEKNGVLDLGEIEGLDWPKLAQ